MGLKRRNLHPKVKNFTTISWSKFLIKTCTWETKEKQGNEELQLLRSDLFCTTAFENTTLNCTVTIGPCNLNKITWNIEALFACQNSQNIKIINVMMLLWITSLYLYNIRFIKRSFKLPTSRKYNSYIERTAGSFNILAISGYFTSRILRASLSCNMQELVSVIFRCDIC